MAERAGRPGRRPGMGRGLDPAGGGLGRLGGGGGQGRQGDAAGCAPAPLAGAMGAAMAGAIARHGGSGGSASR
ncbi:MAG: hypothetical protein FJX19_11760 [Alphaproteobacteria bacterium]|nr:hypothetical protein [Alphaproteobacteria bacterium]